MSKLLSWMAQVKVDAKVDMQSPVSAFVDSSSAKLPRECTRTIYVEAKVRDYI